MKEIIGTYSPAAENLLGGIIIGSVCIVGLFFLFCLLMIIRENLK